MASIRACRPLSQAAALLRQSPRISHATRRTVLPRAAAASRFPSLTSSSPFHTTPRTQRMKTDAPQTDLGALNVLADAPVPATSVDVCAHDGFHLNSGAKVVGGSGVLLVGGEAFVWNPWLARAGGEKRLLNSRGQWDVPRETLGLFGLVWPRPGRLCSVGMGVCVESYVLMCVGWNRSTDFRARSAKSPY